MVHEREKPALLYFSAKPVDPDKIEIEQIHELRNFKKEIMHKGILGNYSTIDELKGYLFNHITDLMRNINLSSTVDTKVLKKAVAERSSQAVIDSDPVEFEYSTEKSFVVRKNIDFVSEKTKGITSKLIKTSKGSALTFSNKRIEEVARALGIEPIIQKKST